ncbi:MAG: PQQ-binding-like beta-propeller repeat protein [Streptosporangiaceae bacterium]
MGVSRTVKLSMIAAVALAAAAVAPAGPALAAGHSPALPAATSSGARLWANNYKALKGASGAAVAVSPSGATVFAAGGEMKPSGRYDGLVVAYSATTGAILWKSVYSLTSGAEMDAIAVSPDGSTVFATGPGGTIAYAAGTGAVLWTDASLGGAQVVVSADGSTVFVTSNSGATVAYSAATGALVWQSTTTGFEIGLSLTVSPDGSVVYAVGIADGGDCEAVAYNAATGATLWQAESSAGGRLDQVAVTPDGSTVVASGPEIALGFNAATGAQLWVRTITTGEIGASQSALAMSTSGSAAFVSQVVYHISHGIVQYTDYETRAYNTATGATVWQKVYKDGLGYGPSAAGVSPDGSTVFVTGTSTNTAGNYIYTTVAYSTASGAQLWIAHFEEGAKSQAEALAVSPDAIFVTGTSSQTIGQTDGFKLATVAYSY